jgi:hypothetical protein
MLSSCRSGLLLAALGCALAFASEDGDRPLVSHADLVYSSALKRSDGGMPLGNGRMGSLVWTSPRELKLQINRVDVFAVDSARVRDDLDYCGGCGIVDIAFGDDVFPKPGEALADGRPLEKLSVYDALGTVCGNGVVVRLLAWHERDLMAIELDDQHPHPRPVTVSLRMLRAPQVRTRNHLALSQVGSRDGRILLTQAFREDDFYCGSAVAIGVAGRTAAVKPAGEREISLNIAAGKGRCAIYIASAASMRPGEDLIARALGDLNTAAAAGFNRLAASNATWWREFWAKSFIRLHSADGVADEIEKQHTYFLYLMAASSRGPYPPKFNGGIWTTEGDTRKWGSQFWWYNTSCLYPPLPTSNHLELIEPLFDMYGGMAESCAAAARQQWGSQGIYIPETVAFNGLDRLPDSIARELQDILLERKPWEQRSKEFREFRAYEQDKMHFSSRWNFLWRHEWRGNKLFCPPYGWHVHFFAPVAKAAYLFWQAYEFNGDKQWLRDRAYPMLKGAAEPYRHYPKLRRDPAGRYHIYDVNNLEYIWGAKDAHEEMCAMHGILPIAIRAAAILDVDAQLRKVWKEFLEKLAPIPTSDHPDSLTPNLPDGRRLWAAALRPFHTGWPGRPFWRTNHNYLPVLYYDLFTLENPDSSLRPIAHASYEAFYDAYVDKAKVKPLHPLRRLPACAALLGRSADVAELLPLQCQAGNLANRMSTAEGPQAHTLEHLGNASLGLQLALCQSIPPGPGEEPVIRVFPAWPSRWDASFKLACRRGFLVTASIHGGAIERFEVHSQLGNDCRIRSPWPGSPVRIVNARTGADVPYGLDDAHGKCVLFKTEKGRTYDVTCGP